MVTRNPHTRGALITMVLLTLTGCSTLRTHQLHYGGTDTLLRLNDPAAALQQIQAHTPPQKDQLLHLLNVGMLQHWNGEYQASNQTLERANTYFEKQHTHRVSELPLRIILNDNAADYAGDDAEEIYLHIFKALNYIALDQPDQAWVEIRRIDQKLIQLQTKYTQAYTDLPYTPETFTPPENHPFHESALGRWLGMLLYRNDGLWDDVRIDHDRLQMAFAKQRELYPFPPPNLENFNQTISSKHVRLSLIGFHGRTPLKEAHALYLHTEKNLVLILNTQTDELGQSGLTGWNAIRWPGIDPGLHLKIELPRIQSRLNEIAYIEAQINQDPPLRLQKIESLETISQQIFKHRQPLLYIRTLTRAAGKGWAFQAGTKPLTEEMNDGWATLTRLAVGTLLSQTEHADLRTARFFPATTSIGELILPTGTHTLQFHYYTADGRLLRSDPPRTLNLQPNQLHLEQAVYLN
jgi:hypothetical protein